MKIFMNFLDVLTLVVTSVVLGFILSMFPNSDIFYNIYFLIILFFLTVFTVYLTFKLVKKD